MTRQPVTIVTVTKNDLAGLQCTMASIAAQTLTSLQHIVIDGGSVDGTLAWLSRDCASHNALVLSEPDRGIYDAMNKGLKLASGTLIAFMNSGDTYALPDVLERATAHHAVHGWEWGHGRARVVDEGGQSLRPLPALSYRPLAHAFSRNKIVHQTLFVETEVLKQLGGFDLRFPIAADFYLAMLLGRRTLPGLWPEVDVDFLVGGLSDVRYGRSLWDMHRARCAAYGLAVPLIPLDAAWTALLIGYVWARRTAKRVVIRALGDGALSWWVRRRG